MKDKRIIVNVPAEVHQAFKMLAVKKGLTMTEMIIGKIKELINEKKGDVNE